MDPTQKNDDINQNVSNETEQENHNNYDEVLEPEPQIDVGAPHVKRNQLILGIAAGIGMMLSLFLPLFLDATEGFFKYLFLIVFVVEVFVQRQLQNKYNVRFVLFTKAWIISMVAALAAFIVIGFTNGHFA